jgi:hypothetical protein
VCALAIAVAVLAGCGKTSNPVPSASPTAANEVTPTPSPTATLNPSPTTTARIIPSSEYPEWQEKYKAEIELTAQQNVAELFQFVSFHSPYFVGEHNNRYESAPSDALQIAFCDLDGNGTAELLKGCLIAPGRAVVYEVGTLLNGQYIELQRYMIEYFYDNGMFYGRWENYEVLYGIAADGISSEIVFAGIDGLADEEIYIIDYYGSHYEYDNYSEYYDFRLRVFPTKTIDAQLTFVPVISVADVNAS